MNLKERYQKIEDYLKNRLSDQERQAFEKQFQQDPALRQEVADHQTLMEVSTNTEALEFKKTLSQIQSQYEAAQDMDTTKTLVKRQRQGYALYGVAAALAVLVGVGVYLYFQAASVSYPHLLKEFYEPYTHTRVLRGADTQAAALLREYHQGHYPQIVERLEAVVDTTSNTQWHLYLANAYIALQQPVQAVKTIENIEEEDPYFEYAQWYQALAWVQVENKAKALATLQRLIDYDGIFKEKAQQLQKKLNKVKE